MDCQSLDLLLSEDHLSLFSLSHPLPQLQLGLWHHWKLFHSKIAEVSFTSCASPPFSCLVQLFPLPQCPPYQHLCSVALSNYPHTIILRSVPLQSLFLTENRRHQMKISICGIIHLCLVPFYPLFPPVAMRELASFCLGQISTLTIGIRFPFLLL